MSPLVVDRQEDFGGGAQQAVAPHLIDARCFYTTMNGMLEDDGSVFKRGGSVKHTKAAFGTSLRSVWEGNLIPGRRTLVASSSAFGVLAANDEEVLNLGGVGFPTTPKPAVAYHNLLFIGGGVIYGGSRKTADYSTGTVTVTQGSATVTGSGTLWLANVDVGMLFRQNSAGQRIYIVKEVKSNTEIVLHEAYENVTAIGTTYTCKRLETASSPYVSSPIYAVAGDRLIAVVAPRTVKFSEPKKPHLYEATIFPQETKVKNEHELEEGVVITGAVGLGVDKLIVFHTGGTTSISNMAKSIVDGLGNSQHRIDIVSRDIVLWHQNGVAAYRQMLVVPAVDEVYLIDGVSSPVPLAGSILPRYRERLKEGLLPGLAVTLREHYLLPLIDTSGVPQDFLYCRLDRPFASNGKTYYPWGFLAGAGAAVTGLALRRPAEAGEAPRLLASCKDGYLLDALSWFEPEDQNAKDHDGSTPLFSLTLRDFSVKSNAIARWRKFELHYELWALDATEPLITCEVGTGVRKSGLPQWDEVKWDEFEWASDEETEFELLEEGAPPNAGDASELAQNEYVWLMKPEARHTRYRLQCADPVVKLVIRGIQLFAVQPGSARRSRIRN